VNWNGQNEGGFSDENLRTFAQMTGLFLTQFDECMATNKYRAKVEADRDAAIDLGVNSTPTIFLDGVNLGGLRDYGFYRVRIEEALAELGG
jgi:protein-disulfide isomerase